MRSRSSFRLGLPRAAVVLVVILAAIGVVPKSARSAPLLPDTFDVRVIAYCHSPSCNFQLDETQWRNVTLGLLGVVNRIWVPNQISFRPAGGDPTGFMEIHYDDKYSRMTAVDPGDDALLDELEAKAAQEPGVITIYLFEDIKKCFSNGSGVHAALFCNVTTTVKAWAHELGHAFCLEHTMTFEDAADNSPVDHDLDDEESPGIPGSDPPVLDTNADPGVRECYDPNNPMSGEDFFFADCNGSGLAGTPKNDHEWCDPALQGSTASPATDPGSYFPTHCTVQCKEKVNDVIQNTGYTPLPEDAMSYYDSYGCMGPYVLQGVAHEAFTQGPDSQAARVAWCRANVSPRKELIDVCEGSGDPDRDGICGSDAGGDDDCPLDADTLQIDSDGDGLGNVCDLCAYDSTPATIDTDNDGQGDLCDTDDDNDGCLDGDDQHPTNALEVLDTIEHPGCPQAMSHTYDSEGIDSDSDRDKIKNCQDADDDGDGICDEGGPAFALFGCHRDPSGADPCPLVPNAGGPCPVLIEPCLSDWQPLCLGGGCEEFLLKVVDAVNPDPASDVIVEKFGIVGGSLYLFPGSNQTLSQLGNALQGKKVVANAVQAATARAAAEGDRLRIEIWDRRANTLRAVVAEYDPATVDARDLLHGEVLSVTPPGDRVTTMSIGATWAMGARPGALLKDVDRDGIPDASDNCRLMANAGQWDSNRDGFGNRCDADLDNDGVVTQADVDAVNACKGANLNLAEPYAEPDDPVSTSKPGNLLKKVRCADADLDGSGLVNFLDAGIAKRALGKPPGPSGKASVD